MNQLNLEQAMSTARTATELPVVPQAAEQVCFPAHAVPAPGGKPAWLLLGVSVLSVCALFWAHSLGSRDCQSKPLPLVVGFNTEISVTMPAGVPCTIAMQPGAPVQQLTITAEPGNGTLAARGRTGVTYRPHPKFRGEDRFSFSLTGSSSAPNETSTIHVRAIVK